MERIPVWLDCDPGHDDAFAILLATYSEKVDLIGISIVHGNDSVDHCSKNALRVLWAFGVKGVPVYNGIRRPLIREPKYCPEIHGIPGEEGVAGMCGYHFPDEKIFCQDSEYKVQELHGIIALSNAILSHPRKVTVVLTGAQTNFAFALRMFPDIKDKIDKIVFMGGAVGLGNTGIAAEYNIQIDPEAAAVVLHSGIPLVMVPLEVTHKVLVTPSIFETIANIDNATLPPEPSTSKDPFTPEQLPHRHIEYSEISRVADRGRKLLDQTEPNNSSDDKSPKFSSSFAECCHQLLSFFQRTYSKEFGFTSPPLHDPCTIFYLTNPQAFHTIPVYVDVEMGSEKCAGRTLCDINDLEKKPKNVLLCTDIRVDSFWHNLLSTIQRASRNSPMNKRN